jgi:hypothetical protein
MDKPGRNDPCYCGSGKKYKQCHMAADLAAEREQRAWADAARELRADLLDYADEERFDAEAGEAAAHYWNGLYTTETLPLMSDSEAERFLDWFAFDYTLPTTGGRIVELYRDEKGAELPSPRRELLDLWVDAPPMSGYELTGYQRQILHVREMVSGQELDVFEPSGHGNAPLGSLLLGRPVPVHDHHEFFALSAYIPPEEIADLPDKLTAARATDGQAGEDFLRRHNVLFIHHALEQARSAGRPPVARLDPHHTPDGVRRRTQHQRVRVKGPNTIADTAPHVAQTRRKAI